MIWKGSVTDYLLAPWLRLISNWAAHHTTSCCLHCPFLRNKQGKKTTHTSWRRRLRENGLSKKKIWGKIQQSGCRLLVAHFMFTPVIGLFLRHLSAGKYWHRKWTKKWRTRRNDMRQLSLANASTVEIRNSLVRQNKSVSLDSRQMAVVVDNFPNKMLRVFILLINERNHRITAGPWKEGHFHIQIIVFRKQIKFGWPWQISW